VAARLPWSQPFDPPNAPLDERTLAEVERRLGVKLPATYVELLREQNGGYLDEMLITVPRRVSGALADHVDDGYVSIGSLAGVTLEECHGSVLHTRAMTEEWELPPGLVLLDGDGHAWIALDYRRRWWRRRAEPPVILVESDSGQTTELRATFAAFLAALVPYDEIYDQDGALRPTNPTRR
jgi:hypothetical protein